LRPRDHRCLLSSAAGTTNSQSKVRNQLKDIDTHLELYSCLETILPLISSLQGYRPPHSHSRKVETIQQVAWRAGELESLLESVTLLNDTLSKLTDQLESEGMRHLYSHVKQVEKSEAFQHLKVELPKILPKLRAHASVTIGVNLDQQLRPIEATLLSVNEHKFRSSTMLDRLWGSRTDESPGVGPLHRLVDEVVNFPSGSEFDRRGGRNPMLVPLFRDLAEVLQKVSAPISKALQAYVDLNGHFLVRIREDINFYLAGVRLARRLREEGLPICQPEICPPDERVFEMNGSYNLNLARHFMLIKDGKNVLPRIVQNDVKLNKNGAIQILTGPNQGGKTTYTQMVGINQVLAQAGLYVPGTAARISPVDNIYTHYPLEEELELSTGRFGDEAQRISDIFSQATKHSLLLFNESLSSTSPKESIHLAQNIVRILRQMGTRAVFNTHLHELAASVDELNESVDGESYIISMIASAQESESENGKVQRSYKIIPGAPLGHSHASEIAERYGISYEQLAAKLKERGVLNSKDKGNE
ncbi:MAG: hypothetical protein AAGD96_30595, partial [Chloroflexota bacterium]